MKVLIGTPIHVCKDYCMERWLQNVAELTKVYPADLFMVDNSPNLDYIEKVKGYCAKYGMRPTHNGQDVMCGVQDYKIEYLDIPQGKIGENINEETHKRVARAREIIRREILDRGYDAWFSWECDQIIPTDALDKLVQLQRAGNFMLVDHNCWASDVPGLVNFDFGVSLFTRECLEKHSFIPEFGSPGAPDSWYNAERWFRMRLKKDGCSHVEVVGVIDPIYHLGESHT